MRTFTTLVLMAATATASEPMNVMLIVSDDLCNTALRAYGSKLAMTPHFDKLAAEGVRFDRAYCQFPLCNPSRSSFMTGLRPDTIEVYENATLFRTNRPDTQTLPQTFRKAGYFVARVGKIYHYGVPAQIGTDGLDDPASWEKVINPRGYDKDDEDADRIFTLAPQNMGSARYGGVLSWLASEGPDREQTDGKIATEITQLLETHRDRPFFLACGFFRPHTPYVAPKAYFEKYPLSEFTLPVVPAGHRNAGPDAAFGSHRKEHDLLTEKLTREALQAYYASTSFMDAQLGRVLDTLERLNLKQKTIVVFFSDHGYHLGEHGLWQKMSLWENSARVPLVIYDPRAAGNGQACSRTVELVDLHATLADLCGLTAPKTDGQSLKPLLDNPSAAWDKPAITQVSRGTPVATGEVRPKRQGWFMGYSVRNERYRYTEWDGGSKGVQLHDLEADPNEWSNLAADPRYQETLASLKKYIPSRRNHD